MLLGGGRALVEAATGSIASMVSQTTLLESAAFHSGFVLGVSADCLHSAHGRIGGLDPVFPSERDRVDPGGHGTRELGHIEGLVRILAGA